VNISVSLAALAMTAIALYVTTGFLLWDRIRLHAMLDNFGGDPDALVLFAAEAGRASGNACRAAWTLKAAYVLAWPLFLATSAVLALAAEIRQ
jgi:hypothetical protein